MPSGQQLGRSAWSPQKVENSESVVVVALCSSSLHLRFVGIFCWFPPAGLVEIALLREFSRLLLCRLAGMVGHPVCYDESVSTHVTPTLRVCTQLKQHFRSFHVALDCSVDDGLDRHFKPCRRFDLASFSIFGNRVHDAVEELCSEQGLAWRTPLRVARDPGLKRVRSGGFPYPPARSLTTAAQHWRRLGQGARIVIVFEYDLGFSLRSLEGELLVF